MYRQICIPFEEDRFLKMSDVPSHSRLVCSLDEIKNCTGAFVHIAIKRYFGYYHHIVVNNWEEAKKTIFEYSVTIHNLFNYGEVTEKEFNEKEISEMELEKNILAKNVYIIDAPDYPKTPQEIWEAIKRLYKRLKEKAYSAINNNCEHLAKDVLTGKPKSEQIQKASAIKKLAVDSFDTCIINGKSNMKKIPWSLLSCIPVQYFIKVAIQAVKNEAKKSAVRMGAPIINETFTRTAKYLCKNASKQMGRDPSCLLNSKPCMSVAEEASKKALKSTALTSFLVTGTIEVVYARRELSALKQQQKDGIITQDDYDREWYKKISGAVGATVGSVGLGVLGQTLFPVPVVGYAIGNAVGNFFGRWFSSAFAGYCFDTINQ